MARPGPLAGCPPGGAKTPASTRDTGTGTGVTMGERQLEDAGDVRVTRSGTRLEGWWCVAHGERGDYLVTMTGGWLGSDGGGDRGRGRDGGRFNGGGGVGDIRSLGATKLEVGRVEARLGDEVEGVKGGMVGGRGDYGRRRGHGDCGQR